MTEFLDLFGEQRPVDVANEVADTIELLEAPCQHADARS
jgi:hypothetical protein